MSTYRVIVSAELIPALESGERLPAGCRMIRIVGEVPGRCGEPPSWRCYYVEFEDPAAPPELEGALVEPAFRAHYDDEGNWVETTIVDRWVSSP